KLPPRLLKKLLESCAAPWPSGVVLGPRYGEDAAVIETSEKYLVFKTDPITFTADHIGWYAVNINANDLATMGARPRWFLATFLFPQGRTTEALVEKVFGETLKACRTLGIALCGGHTEITVGLDRPIVVGQMLGEVDPDKLVRKEQQRPGDLVILTKGVAIEGTAILTREKTRWLKGRIAAQHLRRSQRLLQKPGISVLRDAQVALAHGEVHAMHDPTEGGVLTGLVELARAGRVGLRVWKEKIPVLAETLALARDLEFDPLSLLASGSLLITAERSSAPGIVNALHRRRIAACIIGEIRPAKDGIKIVENGRARPIKIPERDEIARLLDRSARL
ncbi:MAG TPA: AIR synthase related protein, partial [Terriglobia bacterium]|nr:AIR synthase related protein [Terriglobia bacterium]